MHVAKCTMCGNKTVAFLCQKCFDAKYPREPKSDMDWSRWSIADLRWFFVCFHASEPYVRGLADEALAELGRREALHVVDALAVDRQLEVEE